MSTTITIGLIELHGKVVKGKPAKELHKLNTQYSKWECATLSVLATRGRPPRVGQCSLTAAQHHIYPMAHASVKLKNPTSIFFYYGSGPYSVIDLVTIDIN